jgi:hypothetical protein
VRSSWAAVLLVQQYQVHVDTKLEEGTDIPTLYDAVERFRNNLRLNRATTKAYSHTAFATLQEQEATELSAESADTVPSKPKKRSNCVCGENHYFSQCPYLIKQCRLKGWSPNDQIQKEIDEKLAKNPTLKSIVEQKQKRANEQAKQRQKKPFDNSGDATEPQEMSAVSLTSFAVDLESYELRDTWILNSGANSHVCNDRRRFKFEHTAAEGEELVAGKSVYPIKAFGSVSVTIKSPNGPTQIQLLNVALVPGFFINTASLHRFTAKEVH